MRIRYFCALALASLLGAQDTAGVGSVKGVVRGTDGQLLSDVRVCLPQTVQCSQSTASGSFHLTDLRAGLYRLEIQVPGQPAFSSAEVEVRAGLEATLEIAVDQIDTLRQSVTVSDSVFVPTEEIKTSGFLIQRYEIFKAAGAQQDVSRYVQTLPGVGTGTNDFRNDLIVRGGSPLENLFIVDNVEIPNINNFANFAAAGGTTSLLDPDLIRDVTFLTGGYPAPYVNRTSSVLQIAQREGNREAFSGRLSLGSAGLGAILEGPLRKRGSWIFSGKRSFIDAFTKDIGIGGVPVNYNYNSKALYDVSGRDRIWLVNITGVDKIRLGATDKEQSTSSDRNPELNLLDIRYQGWRSATGLNWQRIFGARGVGLLGITHSEASVAQTVKDLFKFGLTAPTSAELIAKSPILFREDNREAETTTKYDLTTYLPGIDKLQAGGSIKVFRVRYATDQPFGQDSPFSIIRNVNPFSLRQSTLASQSSLYAQSSRNFTSRLNLTLGGRFDHYQAIGKSRLSPRAGLSYRITEKLSFRSSYGLYFQQPLLLFIQSFPQNRGLSPIRASHMVTGFSYTINSSTRASVEAYQKTYSNYPVSTQFPSFSLANAGDTFAVSDILLPYASAGRGRVRGIEFQIEKRFSGHWYGQTNVSLSKTRHAGLDGVLRPGTYDYPIIFNALAGYTLRKKWDISGRFVFLSGKPYTPFDQTLSQSQNRGIYDLARVNGLRAPDYLRLDIRVDRTFTVRNQPFLVFVGLQNVTNRRNIAQASWDRTSNELRFNRQLGLFPLIGLDWKF
ncbi:MAG: TonB-dependent receptor [Bryobacteraceae bacterium]